MSSATEWASSILDHVVEAFRADRPLPVDEVLGDGAGEAPAFRGIPIQTHNTPLYTALQPEEHQIRVAVILPGIWRDTLQCELKTISLDNVTLPPFEALSYCWGDRNDTRLLALSGRQVQVSANLYNALKRLRRREKERLVWADAICINQSDLRERQHQVGIMADIYRSATEVQVFLGERNVSSPIPEHAMDDWDEYRVCRWYNDSRDKPMLAIFGTLSAMEFNFSRDSANDQLAGSFRPWMREICAFAILSLLGNNQCLEEIAMMPMSNPWSATWDAGMEVLVGLFEQPWWRRIWCVQEIVLAKEATVHFGQTVFPWAMLEAACAKIIMHSTAGCCQEFISRGLPPASRFTVQQIGLVIGPLVVRRNRFASTSKPPKEEDTTTWDLLEVLKLSRARDATDQRDKVYAILGLLEHGWDINSAGVGRIEPDYSKDVVSVFTLACLKVIEISGNLAVLSHNTPAKVTPSLPSWVPDWYYSRIQTGHNQATTEFRWDGEEPLGGTRPVVALQDTPGRGGRRLRIRGVPIGSIRQAIALPGLVWPETASQFNTAAARLSGSAVAATVRKCREMVGLPSQASVPPFSPGRGLDARETQFWCALLGDECSDRRVLEHHLVYLFYKYNGGIPPHEHIDVSGMIHRGRPRGTARRADQGAVGNDTKEAFDKIWSYFYARTFFVLENGLFGITPVQCSAGDQLYWFLGGKHPFILKGRTGIVLQAHYTQLPEFQLLGPCDIGEFSEGKREIWMEESHDVVLV